MVSKIVNIKGNLPYRRQDAMRITEEACRWEASAVLRDSSATINLKSVIGLLSMAISGRTPVELICFGPDEAQAIEAVQGELERPTGPGKN